jgi:polysaccharide pyruvyl transferase WcaK-like protein
MGKEKHIFDFYRKADLTLGMRFHSNVCSIGLNTPSIALLTYPKIFDLCKGLGLEDRAVWVNEKGFSEQLIAKTLSSLEQKKDIKQRYATIKEGLVHDIEIVMGDISSWLERNRLI